MKFKLTAAAVLSDVVLPEGTIIGDGTDYPVRKDIIPGSVWEPQDDEARKAMSRRKKTLTLNDLPLSMADTQRHELEAAAKNFAAASKPSAAA